MITTIHPRGGQADCTDVAFRFEKGELSLDDIDQVDFVNEITSVDRVDEIELLLDRLNWLDGAEGSFCSCASPSSLRSEADSSKPLIVEAAENCDCIEVFDFALTNKFFSAAGITRGPELSELRFLCIALAQRVPPDSHTVPSFASPL